MRRTAALVVLLIIHTMGSAQTHQVATIHGQKVVLPVPSGMRSYPLARALSRADMHIPDANELVALFVPPDSAEHEEPYYMMVQVYRKEAYVGAEQLAKVAEGMAASGVRPDLLKKVQAAVRLKQEQLRKDLGDGTAKLVPLGLVTRGYLLRSENVQALNSIYTLSVTLRGREEILSRAAHVAIVRLKPKVLAFVYFYGEFDEPPDTNKYEPMMRRWLLDFDKQNNGK